MSIAGIDSRLPLRTAIPCPLGLLSSLMSNAAPASLAAPRVLVNWSVVERRRYLLVACSLFCGALVLAMDSRVTVASHDMFHALALFRYIVDTGSFPTGDVFAFTPTRDPVVHHEWLFGGVLYLFTEVTGWGIAGVATLKFALFAGSAVGLARIARIRGASASVTIIVLCVALAFGWNGLGTLRAQMFTLFFLVVLINLLESYRAGNHRLAWFWPPLMVCWMNIHGGFVVGCGLYLWHTIEATLRTALGKRFSIGARIGEHKHLWGAGILSLPCLMLNPYGWQYVPYLVSALRMPRPRIAEWAPLSTMGMAPMAAWSILVGVLCYALCSKQRANRHELTNIAFLVLAAVMTFRHARHGGLLAVLSIAYVPSYLMGSSLGLRFTALSRRYAAAVVPALVLLTIALLCQATQRSFWRVTLPTTAATAPFHYPAGAVQHLADLKFTGRLMTSFTDGAYVSWRLFPNCLVSMDGRYEAAYPDGAAESNADFYAAAPGWHDYLAKIDPDAILVAKRAPLYKHLIGDRRGFVSGLGGSDACGEGESQKQHPRRARPPGVLRGKSVLGESLTSDWLCCYEDPSYAIFSRSLRVPRAVRSKLPGDAPFSSRSCLPPAYAASQ